MKFNSAEEAEALIRDYFEHIAGEFHFEEVPDKHDDITRKKVWDRDAEPPTISGLTHHLGFDSRTAFEQYERDGLFASALKSGRLRIEIEYEKRLHQPSPSGAIFALKNLGWNERDNASVSKDTPQNIKVEITDAAVPTAGREQDVDLS